MLNSSTAVGCGSSANTGSVKMPNSPWKCTASSRICPPKIAMRLVSCAGSVRRTLMGPGVSRRLCDERNDQLGVSSRIGGGRSENVGVSSRGDGCGGNGLDHGVSSREDRGGGGLECPVWGGCGRLDQRSIGRCDGGRLENWPYGGRLDHTGVSSRSEGSIDIGAVVAGGWISSIHDTIASITSSGSFDLTGSSVTKSA